MKRTNQRVSPGRGNGGIGTMCCPVCSDTLGKLDCCSVGEDRRLADTVVTCPAECDIQEKMPVGFGPQ
jgi:hypothetical protein